MSNRDSSASRRWFGWSCVCAAGIVLLLANVPAQEDNSPQLDGSGKYGPHFECRTEGVHGWPIAFLWRRPVQSPGPFWNLRWSIWRPTEGVIRFSPLNLTFDFVAGASVLTIIKLAAEAWGKRHSPLFQSSLKELLAVVVAVGCALGWLHAQRTEYYKQRHVIQTLAANEAWGVHEKWDRGGPTWLRELMGDRYFKWFDRVVEIRLGSDSAGIDLVAELSSLRTLGLPSRMSRSDIAKLHQLRHLTALDFYGAYFDVPEEEMDGPTSDEACHLTDAAFAELATLSSLQGMNLYGSEITGTGLAALSSLDKMHVLDLTDTEVDDEGMPTLGKMTKLRTLSLRSTKITDDGIANLADLDNLEELSLGSTRDYRRGNSAPVAIAQSAAARS